jgi:hypothetical protein
MSFAFNQFGDQPQTTEWEDIHRRRRGQKTQMDEWAEKRQIEEDMTIAYHEAQERLAWERRSLEELDELEDDFSDEFLDEYRQKRIAEMQERARRSLWGSMQTITEREYKEAVNEPEAYVVCLLAQDSVRACRVVEARLKELAAKFPDTKILKIRATDAIHNYPDRNVPTLLVYGPGGKIKKQLVGAMACGGPQVTTAEMEWMLAELDVWKTDLEEDPRGAAPDTLGLMARTGFQGFLE